MRPEDSDLARSFVRFLNAHQWRVVKSLFQTLSGLPHRIELFVLDSLTLQLDRELICLDVML